MFKETIKSVGKLSHSRYEKPYRILAEVYAKLIAASPPPRRYVSRRMAMYTTQPHQDFEITSYGRTG